MNLTIISIYSISYLTTANTQAVTAYVINSTNAEAAISVVKSGIQNVSTIQSVVDVAAIPKGAVVLVGA
jgi:hypothetical protein